MDQLELDSTKLMVNATCITRKHANHHKYYGPDAVNLVCQMKPGVGME